MSQTSNSSKLFDGVVYKIDQTMSSRTRNNLEVALSSHGAIPAKDTTPTHAITESPHYDLGPEIAHVSPKWVMASIKGKHVQNASYFSLDPLKFFSGVIISTSGIPPYDRDTMFGGTQLFGGQYRLDLTEDVTHLMVAEPEGEKYTEAIADPEVSVVMPDWFNACIKHRRHYREDMFKYPDPPILRNSKENEKTAEEKEDDEELTLLYPYDKTLPYNYKPKELFLKEYTFFLSSDLMLPRSIKRDLIKYLERAGARVLSYYDSLTVDVVIMKWRGSKRYIQACQDKKIIGSFWWATNTLCRERFVSPLKSLLDYPVPKGGIPALKDTSFAVSGYRQEARKYVVSLITAIGGKYTKQIVQNSTTHLISSRKNGPKYEFAKENKIPAINHLWLEETFQQWECKPLDDERYTTFPDEDILNAKVGKTPVCPKEVERWMEEPLPEVTPLPNQPQPNVSTTISNEEDMSREISFVTTEDQQAPETPRSEVQTNANAKANANVNVNTNTIDDNEDSGNGDNGDSTYTESSQAISRQRRGSTPFGTQKRSHSEVETSSQKSQGRKKKVKQTAQVCRIATTCVALSEKEKSNARALGAQFVESIAFATHLVSEDRIIRTPKFLCAINLGLHIIRREWIKDSIEGHEWQDEKNYAIHDKESEKKLGFSLDDSLNIARERIFSGENGWLDGLTVYLPPKNRDSLKQVVETAGGKVVLRKPLANDDVLVISEDKDPGLIRLGFQLYSPDLVIHGTLQQKLLKDKYLLW
ncbi:BRCT domain-containing protein [Phycomyces blakesleeanus]|uniref:BRCT domain-containing protein n=2 Tax=Phycomyces blakesleeanus TaxID=4837 RepID=A0A162NE62_PHYB8|nr:hypothetical protein PHYBLDRAFT_145879 [Phycomyces blakesleeanus NRRL 1555(-)]OAD73488.1 hypothetical protein PHYBLDRAFT_145879 [Phycomyces blakesleeanus NRRL 1555(-)]|eukprot:XP_018291528.1 hypothetical protein PHYBLDRAFT_145879 [Phycomyces blakesleeanus NRRL 1555(-)]